MLADAPGAGGTGLTMVRLGTGGAGRVGLNRPLGKPNVEQPALAYTFCGSLRTANVSGFISRCPRSDTRVARLLRPSAPRPTAPGHVAARPRATLRTLVGLGCHIATIAG